MMDDPAGGAMQGTPIPALRAAGTGLPARSRAFNLSGILMGASRYIGSRPSSLVTAGGEEDSRASWCALFPPARTDALLGWHAVDRRISP